MGIRGDRRGSVARALIACILVILVRTASANTAGQASDGKPIASGGGNPLTETFPVIFDSEWIRLFIIGDSVEVRGTYWLLCRERTFDPVPLFYPFPRDSMLGGARMVSLRARVGPGDPVPASWKAIPGARGARWWVPPCAGDTIAFESVYRQKLLSDYARYIVTTTRSWDRALRRARFEIHLPPGAEPVEFSFPFERRGEGGRLFYAFEADSFFPDRDITVRWRR